MLDAFIIEEIKRRERMRRDERDRPAVELPLPPPEEPTRRRGEEDEDKPQRGVVVIDLSM